VGLIEMQLVHRLKPLDSYSMASIGGFNVLFVKGLNQCALGLSSPAYNLIWCKQVTHFKFLQPSYEVFFLQHFRVQCSHLRGELSRLTCSMYCM
jgi:hypothetical protein